MLQAQGEVDQVLPVAATLQVLVRRENEKGDVQREEGNQQGPDSPIDCGSEPIFECVTSSGSAWTLVFPV